MKMTLTITTLTPGAGVPPLLIGPNNTATVTIADDDVMVIPAMKKRRVNAFWRYSWC